MPPRTIAVRVVARVLVPPVAVAARATGARVVKVLLPATVRRVTPPLARPARVAPPSSVFAVLPLRQAVRPKESNDAATRTS